MTVLIKTFAITIVAAAGLGFAPQAIAADPIYSGSKPVVAPKSATTRVVYAQPAYRDCEDLIIDYRDPYPPHREIVRACEVD